MCVFDSKKIGWKKYMCVIMVDGIFEKHLWLEIKIYNYLLMKKKQIGNTYIYIITMMNKVFFFVVVVLVIVLILSRISVA